jgi:glycosyltransferase involved in cell wall biosynthesis
LKLLIQIPCYNESETLEVTIRDLPTRVNGFDVVEYLVIDDGSRDGTADEARRLGVHHVVRHPTNLGLARAFQTGIDACLRFSADVIVNTDADNQYPGRYIEQLAAPIVERVADVVIADRQTEAIAHFSSLKRRLQKFGTSVVRSLSGTDVADAPSGFRAYSREAALRLNVLSEFSYTLETIIQAGKMGLKVVNLPIETNPPLRPSRLQKSMFHFITRQSATMLRLYAFYEPLKTFSFMSLPFFLFGGGAWVRFVYLFYTGQTGIGRHVQSLTIGTGLLLVGVLMLLFGLQADIANKHRLLTQIVLYRLRKLEYRLLSGGDRTQELLPDERTVGQVASEGRGPTRTT